METEHAETVVEKAVAYVKDMLGIPPADKEPDVVAKPEYSDAPEPTTEDAMRLDPYTTKSVAEISADRVREDSEAHNGDDLPSDSEMQDEVDRAAHTQDKNRQAQQQSAGW